MKYKKKLAKLEARIHHFEHCQVITQSNASHPGSYTKPGAVK